MRRRRRAAAASACRQFDAGFRAHNTNVYPERPDRCYLGYLDGGIMVLDISDTGAAEDGLALDQLAAVSTASPTRCCRSSSRGLLVVTDECVQDDGADWPKLIWLLDARDETQPRAASARCPMPPVEALRPSGGRYGAHNLHENPPAPGAWRSETIVLGTFFNAGVRAYDICEPVPAARDRLLRARRRRKARAAGAVQINDVFVDDRGIVFAVDRPCGGLYVLEMNV